jgi:hypothetical protein
LLVVLGSLIDVPSGAVAIVVVVAVVVTRFVLTARGDRITARAVVAAVSARVFALTMAATISVAVLAVRGVRTTVTIVDSTPVYDRGKDYLPEIGACRHIRLPDGTAVRGEVCKHWKDNRPAAYWPGNQVEVVADPDGRADARLASGFDRNLWLALAISRIPLLVTVGLAWSAGQPSQVPTDRPPVATDDRGAPRRYRKHKRARSGKAHPQN